ncbi:MAG: sorting protein [Bradyrhizobium sp.]|nr:sorting protein [Bradyrhizobium sp.]
MFNRIGKRNRSHALAIGLACATMLTATAASAAPLITESFETGLTPPAIQYGPDQSPFHNSNAVGPVVIPNFNFLGYAGVITSGASGVFNPAPDGNQTAFLQAYQGDGGEIDWLLSGLTAGHDYRLSFSTAGSLIVPTATFTVGGLGLTQTSYTPGTTFSTQYLYFTATGTSGQISFVTQGGPSNAATALDSFALSAVPEPASWALMLLGFGLLGVSLRRRGNVNTSVTYA